MPRIVELPRSDVEFKDRQLKQHDSPNLAFEVEKEIGHGDNSIVYQEVTPGLPSAPSALKVVSKILPGNPPIKFDVSEIRDEVKYMKKSNHPPILDLKAEIETESELCQHGSL